MTKMLTIQADKCTGCRNCAACLLDAALEGSFRLSATPVHVSTPGSAKASRPDDVCQQCSDAPCLKVCTPHALERDALTGLVKLDRGKCIGCRCAGKANRWLAS